MPANRLFHRRLALGFAGAVVAVMVVAAAAFAAQSVVVGVYDNVALDRARDEAAVARLESLLEQKTLHARSYLAGAEREMLERMRDVRARVLEEAPRLREGLNSREQVALLDGALDLERQQQMAIDDLVRQQPTPDADTLAQWQRDVRPLHESLHTVMMQLQESLESDVVLAMHRARRTSRWLDWLLALIASVSLAAAALLAIVMTRPLLHLYQAAQTGIELRDRLLSVASHELRTPLTVLRLRLHTLRRLGETGRLTPETLAESTRAAHDQALRMGELLDDLLDAGRVREGRFELRRESVDLRALVEETLGRLSPEFSSTGTPVAIGGDAPVAGQWDRSRLDQVVTNLLTNAAKYGAGRPVEITLRRDADRARLLVRDHGIGIAAADLERIFQPFQRTDAARQFRGTGLGLFIAREIVRAHGGELRAESAPGAGAVFTLELPYGAANAARAAAA